MQGCVHCEDQNKTEFQSSKMAVVVLPQLASTCLNMPQHASTGLNTPQPQVEVIQ